MNVEKRIPVPINVHLHNQHTDELNQWYCYASNRSNDPQGCAFTRNDTRGTYFRWDSINASNEAEAPFRYRYWIYNGAQLIAHDETFKTQSEPIIIPKGDITQLMLQTVDRTESESPIIVYEFLGA